MSIHVLSGPTVVLSRRRDGERWCFKCRKRLPHDLVVLGDERPSYYEPVAVLQCSGCDEDHTEFPRSW